MFSKGFLNASVLNGNIHFHWILLCFFNFWSLTLFYRSINLWPVCFPFFSFVFFFSAMQQVLDNLKELPSGTEAKDIDLIFLRGIIESPVVRSLAKARSCGQFSWAMQHIRSSNLIIWSRSWQTEQMSLWGSRGLISVPCQDRHALMSSDEIQRFKSLI